LSNTRVAAFRDEAVPGALLRLGNPDAIDAGRGDRTSVAPFIGALHVHICSAVDASGCVPDGVFAERLERPEQDEIDVRPFVGGGQAVNHGRADRLGGGGLHRRGPSIDQADGRAEALGEIRFAVISL
jgi:hypothetical protein